MRKITSMVLSLTGITAVCGLLLGGLFEVTGAQVQANQQVEHITATNLIFQEAEVGEELSFGRWAGHGLESGDLGINVSSVPQDGAPLSGLRSWIRRMRRQSLVVGDRIIGLDGSETEGMSVQEVATGLAVANKIVVIPAGEQNYIELTPRPAAGRLLYLVRQEGVSRAKGVAFENRSAGFGGQLTVMIGFDLVDGRVTGITVTNHSETPGFGAKAQTDPSFVVQFRDLPLDTGFAVRQDGGQIDAISGATITSRAVCEAVTNAVTFFQDNDDAIRQLASSGGNASRESGGER